MEVVKRQLKLMLPPSTPLPQDLYRSSWRLLLGSGPSPATSSPTQGIHILTPYTPDPLTTPTSNFPPPPFPLPPHCSLTLSPWLFVLFMLVILLPPLPALLPTKVHGYINNQSNKSTNDFPKWLTKNPVFNTPKICQQQPWPTTTTSKSGICIAIMEMVRGTSTGKMTTSSVRIINAARSLFGFLILIQTQYYTDPD